METKIFQEIKSEINELLEFDNLLSDVAVNRALQDDRYLNYLVNCRNDKKLLQAIINDKKNKNYKTLSDEEVLIRKRKKIIKWKKSIYHQLHQNNYQRKLGKYFEAEQKRNPELKSCKPCAEINPDDFREVYLDQNATTHIRPEVSELLADYHKGKFTFANPSSKTVQGDYATELIFNARKEIAEPLSVEPHEIHFTGSGSEANNLAIKGMAFKYLEKKGHLITSKVEHPSVLRVMEYLETIGFDVSYLDVDNEGMVSAESVRKAIRDNTILVSIMAANNEIGTINPIGEIGKICKSAKIPFMVDAVQAFGKISLNPKDMGISLLSVSGHKIYAPKGIAALYVEDGISLVPQIHGGGQEYGLRAGTENVGSIMAFGRAAQLSHSEMENETIRLNGLREYFLEGLKDVEKGIVVNGSMKNRIPNNLSVGFPGFDSGALIRSLNKIGISVSASSACSSKKLRTSYVLTAVGADTENFGTIRFSFGLDTNKEDLDYVLKYIYKILIKLKS